MKTNNTLYFKVQFKFICLNHLIYVALDYYEHNFKYKLTKNIVTNIK